MLRCAASFVTAAYVKVRLIPQALRALPLALFTKPSHIGHFPDFLRGRYLFFTFSRRKEQSEAMSSGKGAENFSAVPVTG